MDDQSLTSEPENTGSEEYEEISYEETTDDVSDSEDQDEDVSEEVNSEDTEEDIDEYTDEDTEEETEVETEEVSEEESDEESEEDSESADEDNEQSQVSEGTIYIDNIIDYSQYFENLQTIGILLCALLVAHALCVSFFKGVRR